MKVLACGDRLWDNYEATLRELEALPTGTVIVHGGCRGADIIAGEIAKALGFEVRVYPAQWDVYGRGAGPVRNRQMLREENVPGEPIDLVIAFHEDISRSRGTADMLRVAKTAGVQTRLVAG